MKNAETRTETAAELSQEEKMAIAHERLRAFLITIGNAEEFYGMRPFVPNRIIRLVKEKDCNVQSPRGIRAELPFFGTIGFVDNSPRPVYGGASRVQDFFERIGKEAFAKVILVTADKAVVLFVSAPNTQSDWKAAMLSDQPGQPIWCEL